MAFMHSSIRWFINNPIAANLLTLIILVGGIGSLLGNMNKEVYPSVPLNIINVSVSYPGASPVEMEEQILKRIEIALEGLPGIKKTYARAFPGFAQVKVMGSPGYSRSELLANVNVQVDSITHFPKDADKPIITAEVDDSSVVALALAGDVQEQTLKTLSQQIRQELSEKSAIDRVRVFGDRDREITIEISEANLHRYQLSFNDIVHAIQKVSLNMPAGVIYTDNGDIQVQTRGQLYQQSAFEDIVLRSRKNGNRLTLGEVATVSKGFGEQSVYARLNGKPAVFLEVYAGSQPDVLKTAAAVQRYVSDFRQQLMPGLELIVLSDESAAFKNRIGMLSSNALSGLVLIYIVLMLFLRPMLATWVCVGIFIAYMGTLWLIPLFGVSINMLSLFAFLVILGIIVDDAIVVGENIYAQQQAGIDNMSDTALGAHQVSKPVIFAVLSTIFVFLPMYFLPGDWPKFTAAIPTITIIALLFSLLESFWILPSHLAHMKPPVPQQRPLLKRLEALRCRFSNGLESFSRHQFRRLLAHSLEWHTVTLVLFILALALSLALVAGNYVGQSFMPKVKEDFVSVAIELPEGTATQKVQALAQNMELGFEQLKQHPDFQARDNGEAPIQYLRVWFRDNRISLRAGLSQDSERRLGAEQLMHQWQTVMGSLPEAESVEWFYSTNLSNSQKPITFQLYADQITVLTQASAEIRQLLAHYPGVHTIHDSLRTGRDDIDINSKPYADHLGVRLSDIAQQVRQGFYGAEVQRIPIQGEDVKVMVRYPEHERRRIDHLETMRIRTPDGQEVPFDAVAEAKLVPGYTSIERINRRRSIQVTAEVSADTSAHAVIDEIMATHSSRLEAKYPGLKMRLGEAAEDEQAFMQALTKYLLLALLAMYALFAIEFRSYIKPLGILTAVPFGVMGAIFGHLFMGTDFSVMSILGVLATAGVVVNDNLVLIDRINRLRQSGMAVKAALLQAGQDRFRPILLTSSTTFIGLIPLLSETSSQAEFLKPMVISLAFGVFFASAVTLLLVPCLYLLGAQLQTRIKHRYFLRPSPPSNTESL